jgi:hypothetical protein
MAPSLERFAVSQVVDWRANDVFVDAFSAIESEAHRFIKASGALVPLQDPQRHQRPAALRCFALRSVAERLAEAAAPAVGAHVERHQFADRLVLAVVVARGSGQAETADGTSILRDQHARRARLRESALPELDPLLDGELVQIRIRNQAAVRRLPCRHVDFRNRTDVGGRRRSDNHLIDSVESGLDADLGINLVRLEQFLDYSERPSHPDLVRPHKSGCDY